MLRKLSAFILVFLLNTVYLSAKHFKMNLQKALDLNLVRVKANSLGSYQGYCIKVELKNLSPDSLLVIFEAGRRLNSLENQFQDILVTHEEMITLGKQEEKSFEVKGYCCQASNKAPFKNLKYDVRQMADSQLVKLARYLSCNNFNKEVEQQAIWAISDSKPTANITSLNDTLLLPLRQLVSNLKGEKLPWYTIISSTYVYSNGVIENFPLWLRGKIKYSNEKESYVTLQVVNEKGMKVAQVKCEWKKACNNEDYHLNIPIRGLAKGKYTIELKTLEKDLVKQEFEI